MEVSPTRWRCPEPMEGVADPLNAFPVNGGVPNPLGVSPTYGGCPQPFQGLLPYQWRCPQPTGRVPNPFGGVPNPPLMPSLSINGGVPNPLDVSPTYGGCPQPS